eukprot:1985552-Prymnesium_polylepis.1
MALLVEPALARTVAADHVATVEVALRVGVAPLKVTLEADVLVLTAAAPADLRLERKVRMAGGVEGALAATLAAEQRAQAIVRPAKVAREADCVVRQLQIWLQALCSVELLQRRPRLEPSGLRVVAQCDGIARCHSGEDFLLNGMQRLARHHPEHLHCRAEWEHASRAAKLQHVGALAVLYACCCGNAHDAIRVEQLQLERLLLASRLKLERGGALSQVALRPSGH